MPMPDRLDRVTIKLLHSDVELPWDSRELLLAELRSVDAAAPIVRAIEGAGASAPVRLKRPNKELLARLITMWAGRTDLTGLPEGVWHLRNGLLDDVAPNRG